MMFSLLGILALSSVASAHFHLHFPYWRGDSFAFNHSQWDYPCANVDQSNSSTNRTSWPLDGGSLLFAGSHPWAHTYVSLGLGSEVTGFNISLVEGFNQTGNGTFCWTKTGQAVLSPLNLAEGQNASIQVIQISHSGAALYNCADVTFSAAAKLLDDAVCRNGTGVGGVGLVDAWAGTSGAGSAAASGPGMASSAAAGNDGGWVIAALAVGVRVFLL